MWSLRDDPVVGLAMDGPEEDIVMDAPSERDLNWSLETFKEDFQIVIQRITGDSYYMEFDLIGIDESLTDAFRRLLIEEVPTMAVDKVAMYKNTCIVLDEFLAFKVGVTAIKADPRLFEFRPEDDEEGYAGDTIEFELKVKCTQAHYNPEEAHLPDRRSTTHIVYTKDLKFIPRGNQLEVCGDIRPIEEDTIIAHLLPGQEIHLKAYCTKGIGKDHPKFSPVALASYCLMPEIELLEEFTGERAHALAHCFSNGVIEVVQKDGKEVAVVANPRKYTSNNDDALEEFKNDINLSEIEDHFIFKLKSSGILPSDVLFLQAVDILKEKCCFYLKVLELNRN